MSEKPPVEITVTIDASGALPESLMKLLLLLYADQALMLPTQGVTLKLGYWNEEQAVTARQRLRSIFRKVSAALKAKATLKFNEDLETGAEQTETIVGGRLPLDEALAQAEGEAAPVAPPPAPPLPLPEQILQAIATRGPQSVKSLAKMLERDEAEVTAELDALFADGKVDPDGGRYYLVEPAEGDGDAA